MKEHAILPSDKSVLGQLKKIDRFSRLSDGDLQLFVREGTIREYESKEVIVEEFMKESFVYLLLSGSLVMQKNGRAIGAMTKLGDVFGDMDFLGGASRATSVVASSKTVVLAIDTSFVDKEIHGAQVYYSYLVYRIFAEAQAVQLHEQLLENERLEAELASMRKNVKGVVKTRANEEVVDLNGKKVLIVDNNETTRKRLRTIVVSELNCNKVFEVNSGDKAVSFLKDNVVDLIFAELNMPKMSGLELLEKVKKMINAENCPFIVYCSEAKTSIEKIKQAADEDVTHYKSTQCIALPFTAKTVIEKVRKTLQSAGKR